MGSFYTLCSITKKTITDGQPTTIQFMMPNSMGHDVSEPSSQMFVDIFLKTAKKEGLDQALKQWEEATKNWGDKINHKGMMVSNEGAVTKFVPFGPSINGYYNDCGDIKLCDALTEYAWVSLEDAKNYDLIEGIYEELEMLDRKLKGQNIGEWEKHN